MTESELIQKVKTGDLSAFRIMYDKYYNWLCNYVLKLCGDEDLAKDIVQETMLCIWEKRQLLLIEKSLKGYLFKTCHNLFIKQVRSKRKSIELLDTIRWQTIFDDNIEAEELFEARMGKLHQLLEMLPPRCKAIFVKNKLEKQKYKDIAAELDISVKTVENHMSKALRIIKENVSTLCL